MRTISYYFAHNDEQSELDYDEGERLHSLGLLGVGTYEAARQFETLSKTRKVVVLNPVSHEPCNNYSWQEQRKRKEYFYSKSHGLAMTFFHPRNPDEYRLVVPFIPGNVYSAYDSISLEDYYLLAYYAAEEVMRIHEETGLVLIDIKRSNLKYCDADRRTYAIDGGASTPIDEPIPIIYSTFRKDLEKNIADFPHVPPECWTIYEDDELIEKEDLERREKAQFSMDSWALGQMLKRMWKYSFDNQCYPNLIKQCIKKKPEQRPSLRDIKNRCWASYRAQVEIKNCNNALQNLLIDFSSVTCLGNLVSEVESISNTLSALDVTIKGIKTQELVTVRDKGIKQFSRMLSKKRDELEKQEVECRSQLGKATLLK